MEMVRTEFNVELVSYSCEKMEAIRKIMSLHRCGMKEAKDFLEKLPRIVYEGMDMYDARQLCNELEKIGCTARIE